MAYSSTNAEQTPLLNCENTIPDNQEQDQLMIDAEDQDHGRALSTFPNTNKLIDDLCVLQQANVSSRPTFPPGLSIPEGAPESGMEAPCWVQQLRQPAKSQENENTIVPKATPLLPAMKSWMRSNGIEESDMIQNEGQENAVENTEEDEIEQMALGSTLLQSILEKASEIGALCSLTKSTLLPLERANNKKKVVKTPPRTPATLRPASTSKSSPSRCPPSPRLLPKFLQPTHLPTCRKSLPITPKKVYKPALPASHPNLEESRYSALEYWKRVSKTLSGAWFTHRDKKLFSEGGFKRPALIPARYRLKYTTYYHFARRHRDLSPIDTQRKYWAKAKMADFRIWKAARLDAMKPGSEWTRWGTYEKSMLDHVECVDDEEEEDSEMEWEDDRDGTNSEFSDFRALWGDDLDLLG